MLELSELKGFGPARLKALERRGIATAQELIERLPVGYRDTTSPVSPAQMSDGRMACFAGYVTGKPTVQRVKGRQWVSAVIADECGKIRCLWFNQMWMKDRLFDTQYIVLYGKAVKKKNGTFVINPTVEEAGAIIPVYAQIPGVGQKLIREAVEAILNSGEVPELLPASLAERCGLMSRNEALRQAHFPQDETRLIRAKERLAFEELLLFQAALHGAAGERKHTAPLEARDEWVEAFFSRMPYAPTGAQRRACMEIAADLRRERAMARMVQGDVGCGKTLIALCALYLCVKSGAQGALMAPTEILAAQHMQTAVELLGPMGITCGLLTGRMTAAEKRRAREAIACGEWQVIIGTHALITQDVAYDNLRLVITDEQHRFGVRQRTMLEGKGGAPHVMVMSATPIPRSLSLVLYGDLDLSIVDELPPGRTPVKTRIVPDDKREGMYAFLREMGQRGGQAYVVCPLVGEEDGETPLKSAKETLAELTQVLAPLRVAMVHGRMKKAEKEEVLEHFYAGLIDVLVATTVIEVGVNVPNATVMVIEDAERFGLAQLHQLRGRVGRGTKESWCFLMAEPNERLKTLTATGDGFVVAQKDLELRGAGEFFGTRQHGDPQMPALMLTADTRLLAQTRTIFMQLCTEERYAQERAELMEAGRTQYARTHRELARN